MKLALLLGILAGTAAVVDAGQDRRPSRGAPALSPAASASAAEAYHQYLLARRLEREDDLDGATAAYKRALASDPGAADVYAELAGLYMRQTRVGDSVTAAEQALKIAPGNVEGHRVL